jgi:hypothetical protein
MIKKYSFVYNTYDAKAVFIVDSDKFTTEHAKATLEFFTWDYDEENDPIDEVIKKYAMEAIKIATFNNYNLLGVISEFDDNEGFCKVDGTSGIELIDISSYEFDDENLNMEIENL